MCSLIVRYLAPSLATLSLLFWSGCGGKTNAPSPANSPHNEDNHGEKGHQHQPGDAKGHTHTGPSGGQLIVLGDDEYHAELLIDHEKGEATVHLLDRTGRTLLPIEQPEILLNLLIQNRPQQVTLFARPTETDPPGLSARFVGSSEILRQERPLAGRLSVEIHGKPYTGQLAHDDRDHDKIR